MSGVAKGCPRCDRDHSRGSPDCPASRLGKTLGDRYRLDTLLGAGGFGAVYRARHLKLDSDFAVKMMLPRFSRNPALAERFLREAKTVAALEHPGIVTVTDFGSDGDGSPYLVMELLRGTGLADLLFERQTQLPVQTCVELAQGALGALAAAHAAGVVHRDLKPENLFCVTPAGAPTQIKILDFGIAKLRLEEEAGRGLTVSGEFLGTIHYSSPEQITNAKRADERSDLYSLGAVLYAMLTGAEPVSGSTSTEVVGHVLSGDIRRHPSELRPEIPDWLDDVVATALARQPQDRYASANEMLVALGGTPAVLTPRHSEKTARLPPDSHRRAEPPTEAWQPTLQPPRSRRPTSYSSVRAVRRRSWLAGVGVLIIAGGGLGWWLLRSADRPPPEDVPTPADLRPGMALVAGGSFTMGSTEEDVAAALEWCNDLGLADCKSEIYERELPPRRVRVRPFLLDRIEVTNGDLAAWLDRREGLEVKDVEYENGATARRVFDGKTELLHLTPDTGGLLLTNGRYLPRPGAGLLAASMVTWHGAARYCQDHDKRLPTEAEWELAARGPAGRPFPWGASLPECESVAFGRSPDGACAANGSRPQDAGTARGDRSPLGILDLGGGVSEWVEDVFVAPYPPCEPECSDPVVREGSELRVARGGNWFAAAEMTRSAGRGRSGPASVSPQIGFRCAANVPTGDSRGSQ